MESPIACAGAQKVGPLRGVAQLGPSAAASVCPGTPPSRRPQLHRSFSSEKLAVPAHRKRLRSPQPLPDGRPRPREERLPSPQQQSQRLPEQLLRLPGNLLVDIGELRSRAMSDAKYWAQIRSAYQLLVESISSELAMSEAVAKNETILQPLLGDAIEEQRSERLSATAMLEVLEALVTEHGATQVLGEGSVLASWLRHRSGGRLDESNSSGSLHQERGMVPLESSDRQHPEDDEVEVEKPPQTPPRRKQRGVEPIPAAFKPIEDRFSREQIDTPPPVAKPKRDPLRRPAGSGGVLEKLPEELPWEWRED